MGKILEGLPGSVKSAGCVGRNVRNLCGRRGGALLPYRDVAAVLEIGIIGEPIG